MPTAAAQVARAEVDQTLAHRQRLTIPAYEDLRHNDANVDQRPSDFPTAAESRALRWLNQTACRAFRASTKTSAASTPL